MRTPAKPDSEQRTKPNKRRELRGLTALAVKNVKAGPTRRELPDGDPPGLFLIVQSTGKKSWALRYRHLGKARKLTLGGYPAIDLATARRLARAALGKVAMGGDPAGEKMAARNAAKAKAASGGLGPTSPFAEVRDAYLAKLKQTGGAKGKPLRDGTLKQAKRLLTKEFAAWDRKPVGDISHRDVQQVLDRIMERGKGVTANRSATHLKAMLRWCVERSVIESAPTDRIKRPMRDEVPRDRVLDASELCQLWRACAQLPRRYADVLRLLVLTGQRKSEIAGMRWEEVNRDRLILPASRTKNARRHELPLSRQAAAILEDLPRIHGGYVFPTADGDSPVAGFSRIKAALDRLLPGWPHWTLHDIRRSVASGMAGIRDKDRRNIIPIVVIERVLNHVSGTFKGIVGVYQRHDFLDEMRDALQSWADYVENLSANVISLPARA
jgi:integrase